MFALGERFTGMRCVMAPDFTIFHRPGRAAARESPDFGGRTGQGWKKANNGNSAQMWISHAAGAAGFRRMDFRCARSARRKSAGMAALRDKMASITLAPDGAGW
ncbi:MAG: hypothetical protein CMF64_01685 [Magnetovibrio sp.]|nr:hypothetical protein [Magnetovibrio sp.]